MTLDRRQFLALTALCGLSSTSSIAREAPHLKGSIWKTRLSSRQTDWSQFPGMPPDYCDEVKAAADDVAVDIFTIGLLSKGSVTELLKIRQNGKFPSSEFHLAPYIESQQSFNLDSQLALHKPDPEADLVFVFADSIRHLEDVRVQEFLRQHVGNSVVVASTFFPDWSHFNDEPGDALAYLSNQTAFSRTDAAELRLSYPWSLGEHAKELTATVNTITHLLLKNPTQWNKEVFVGKFYKNLSTLWLAQGRATGSDYLIDATERATANLENKQLKTSDCTHFYLEINCRPRLLGQIQSEMQCVYDEVENIVAHQFPHMKYLTLSTGIGWHKEEDMVINMIAGQA